LKTVPDTRPGAVVWIAAGLALSAVVHLIAPDPGRARSVIVLLAMIGAVMIGAGVGKLLHGDRVRLLHLDRTPLMWVYTRAGGACGLAHLWRLEYFAYAYWWEVVIVLVMIGLWAVGDGAGPNRRP
jgi:hypothetical protein